MMKMTLLFLYHHPSCHKKYAEYKKLPILHETVSYILVGNSSQQLLSWLIFPTTQEGPDYDLRIMFYYILQSAFATNFRSMHFFGHCRCYVLPKRIYMIGHKFYELNRQVLNLELVSTNLALTLSESLILRLKSSILI